ncbi:MAG: sugar porter family MFS transporter [Acidobacteria bacterium]|nr:sugar porter family MFS transporter [Acidobacteriota bacterium]MBW4044640.1 sugar porter family MFS transporter [Acidobacteriota bacterium]
MNGLPTQSQKNEEEPQIAGSGPWPPPRKAIAGFAGLVSCVAAISGFLFGFDIAVINGAIVLLRAEFHLSDLHTEFAVSSLLVGAIGGAGLAGWLSDRFGRRRVLSFAALAFAASSLGAALPRNFIEFSAARLAGGIAIGIASVVAPMYIAEVSPARMRGRLISLNQMAIVTGILVAYLANWGFSLSGAWGWRWMFASAILPSAVLFFGTLLVPESPRWLVEEGQDARALAVLEQIEGGEEGARQLLLIHVAAQQERSTFQDLLAPALRRPLLLVVALAVLQQVTGINTVLFYGSLIWQRELHPHSASGALEANILVGIVNFAFTILALVLIERLGRKPLLMISSGVMAICQLALGAAFLLNPVPSALVLGAMLFCIASFAIGLGPCTWVLMAELLPTRVRGRAMSVANVALWSASFVLTVSFLTLSHAIGITGTFSLYSMLCVLTFALVWRVVPETKGRSLEEIETLWQQKHEARDADEG